MKLNQKSLNRKSSILFFIFVSILAVSFGIAFWTHPSAAAQPSASAQSQSPKSQSPSSQAGAASYKDVYSVLQQKCLACHSSAAKMGGLVMDSYKTMMKGGAHGPVIVPGNSGKSRLVLMIEGSVQPRMPFNSNPLSPSAIATIKSWIDAGAKGPTPEQAKNLKPKENIPDIKPLVREQSPVGSVAFSPDGKLLAVGGYKEVRLMDPRTGKVLGTLSGHAGMVRSVAFSPDGKWLAAGGGLCQQWGEIKLWDVHTQKLLQTMKGDRDCIYSVDFSPNGKMLASGSYDKLIKFWDPATGKELRTLKDHIDAVFAVAFSPDGKWLASGSQDRSVKIWDVSTGQRLYTLSDPLDGITSIAFSPSGNQIAAAGYDKLIYIWNLTPKGGTLAQSLIADEDSILQIAWSPDGKDIITSSADGSIRIRDAATLNPVGMIGNQKDWVEALSISRDGKWLAAGRYNGTLSIYNMGTLKQAVGPLLAFEPYIPPAAAQTRTAEARRSGNPRVNP